MKKGGKHILGILLVFLTGIATPALAQFKELGPLETLKYKTNSLGPNQKIQAQNTLPFWDDFSQGIDTIKWTNSGASYTETIGNNAPSFGMILFNGVDSNGYPYSFQTRDIGQTDVFTSKPFNLSQLSSGAQNNLYLSFYWQAGGKAEAPDSSDEFVLQILTPQKTWQRVWSTSGGSGIDRNNFKQEIFQILPAWQHSEFQFRFLSEGRRNGPFDSWILDYVYLNTGRTSTDLNYRDRTLTSPNQVLLGDFAAYPLALLKTSQKQAWTTVSNEFINLENRFRAMEYSVLIQDSLGRLISPINLNTPFNPVPNALERRKFESRDFKDFEFLTIESDLYFKTFLTTGDGPLFTVTNGDTTRFESVDYKSNDTVYSVFPIRDFFAYDRGMADYAAGINQKGGQLAVAYSTPQSVFLKGISINFTNSSQANQAVDILIWKDLDSKPVYKKEVIISPVSAGKSFQYFALEENIEVNDTFYIGFAQYTNDFIHIGLDKTNDQGNKINYNVGGGWVENKDVKGSLMVRPHISMEPPFTESNLPETGFRIYPNPVTSLLTVEGDYQEIAIFDSFGRQILLPKESSGQGEIINFSGQRPGIYILNLVKDSKVKSFRIQVNK
ncbi:T9SS type A sorting domain-containing protein [Algoriphagus mannitolivorans]|uniref:T9SS type A sorting domain-containing protein n=1 Tax=Algoriphagus mannitolivorans TaxID=226504 RepID=UPI000407E27C|nr:T9SS type A sorting domain-containing protein [Algoriphagus mannitolivorans]